MVRFTTKCVLPFIIFTFLQCESCHGFLSKFFNGGDFNGGSGNLYHVRCEANKVQPRIALAVVGGRRLSWQQSAPYMAAIGAKTKNGSVEWYCGGSVLSSTQILTAAHCLTSRDIDTVRAGTLRLSNTLSPFDFRVASSVMHPNYKSPQTYHDVAIIKLRDRLPLSPSLRPVCLSTGDEEDEAGTRAQIIGWGSDNLGGEGSQDLQQVQVEVFSNQDCNEAYENSSILPRSFPDGISEEQMCAGSRQGGKDACQGDSGGPLVTQGADGVIRQIGIVSSGEGCGLSNFPGVYVKVSKYSDWILRQLEPETRHFGGGNFRKPPKPIADDNFITFP